MREFVAPLCVKSHHCVRSISTVVKDGYLIVLIQHFQIIYACQVATSGNPIQCLLFIPSSSLGNKLEIVGEERSEFAGIFIGKAFLPCFPRFGN